MKDAPKLKEFISSLADKQRRKVIKEELVSWYLKKAKERMIKKISKSI